MDEDFPQNVLSIREKEVYLWCEKGARSGIRLPPPSMQAESKRVAILQREGHFRLI
jgi:hypothetical protein